MTFKFIFVFTCKISSLKTLHVYSKGSASNLVIFHHQFSIGELDKTFVLTRYFFSQPMNFTFFCIHFSDSRLAPCQCRN